ncbi:MAG: sugar ABC transporter permease [Solirubrobacterales bacterium]|nr:sugar ABC transporter permease [Solirubrobacterales bacterium]
MAPAVLVTVVLFGGALLGAVKQSVEPSLGGGPSTWNLDSWRTLLASPGFLDALRFSAQLALIASVLAASLAVAVAVALRSHGRLVRSAFSLPVPVPHLLVAVVAFMWLSPGGLAQRALGRLPLRLVHDPLGLGVILVYVYKETPFLVLLLLAVMGSTLREREEAAAVFGASPFRVLIWVVWPVIRRPLLIGTMIVAAFVFGAFEVPLVLGPNYPLTLASYALQAQQKSPLRGQGVAAASLLVAAGMSILIAAAVMRLARTADA